MHKLETKLREVISSGLKRRSITKCSTWALNCRVMGPPFPGPWSFDHHPWTRAMHDCNDEMVVGQKAAQMGFTEWALNKAFYHIDIMGESVLYVLPASTPDATDFSTSRFDPALELSPHLRNLFSDVKNVGHKRAGNANLFVRGSRSKSQMRSIPAPRLIFDEVDVMVQENIILAFERASGQVDKQFLLLSTPTIDNFGINSYFKGSTQDHFMFKCPCCSRLTELIFPECLEITAEEESDPAITNTFIKCKDCGGKLEHEDKINFLRNGEWVSSYTNRLAHGYHINQLYSMTVKPYELARLYLKSTSNPAAEQEFYNGKLGLPHIVAGARITDVMLEECTGNIKKLDSPPLNSFIVMGVDVGGWLHYEITQYYMNDNQMLTNDIHLSSKARIITEGKVREFEELDLLMRQYGILFCVIDANPERRKALEFAKRFYGHVRLCFYGNGVSGKQIHLHDESEHTMTVDRTSWLDLSLARFKNQSIILPIDLDVEYKDNIKALVRIYEKDKSGNQVGRYVKGNDDDHYAHARSYNEMAFGLASGLGGSKDSDISL
jgi:hypothetical protein